MIDNHIIIESGLDGSIYSSLRRGTKFESHSFSSISGDFKPEIINLIDDWEMEGTFEESLSNRDPSRDYFETLFVEKSYRGENLVKKPMPPLS
ncbi:unnamed protein product [Vicia faba]|uniref:Uncharacterized protein n=1 Tax=Vicia faba TaxID=3906 RepID=A0AAV1A726_VICFA|nr:unnamed protein product [Vicia faba]